MSEFADELIDSKKEIESRRWFSIFDYRKGYLHEKGWFAALRVTTYLLSLLSVLYILGLSAYKLAGIRDFAFLLAYYNLMITLSSYLLAIASIVIAYSVYARQENYQKILLDTMESGCNVTVTKLLEVIEKLCEQGRIRHITCLSSFSVVPGFFDSADYANRFAALVYRLSRDRIPVRLLGPSPAVVHRIIDSFDRALRTVSDTEKSRYLKQVEGRLQYTDAANFKRKYESQTANNRGLQGGVAIDETLDSITELKLDSLILIELNEAGRSGAAHPRIIFYSFSDLVFRDGADLTFHDLKQIFDAKFKFAETDGIYSLAEALIKYIALERPAPPAGGTEAGPARA